MDPSPHSTCPLCQGAVSELAPSGPGLAESAGTLAQTDAAGGVTAFFGRLLDTSGFPPRWHCGKWDAFLGWLHIGADVGIFLAYAAIPASLLYFILRRRDVPLRGIFWLFAAFILSCGLTHLCDAMMFYYPAYRLLGLMKFITAAVSITTVVALVRVLPGALRLPGQAKLREEELAVERRAKEMVAQYNKQLEDRNSQLTVRQKRIEHALDRSRLGVMRWNAKTGVIEWEVGLREALREDDREEGPYCGQWSDLLDTPELTAMLGASMESVRDGVPVALEVPMSRGIARGRRIRVSASAEKGASIESPIIIGFARVLDGRTVERRVP